MIRRVALVATVCAFAFVMPLSARATEPVRSGTITGWGYTWPAMFSGEARDCQWSEWTLAFGVGGANPECRVWLDSGCDPALAGRDPAATASIEDVSGLADGRTPRDFEWGTDGLVEGDDHGGVVVQMWTADCKEIGDAIWRSGRRRWTLRNHSQTTFSIPRRAAWMTVTTNDTIKVHWTLT